MDNPIFKLEGVVHERSAETLQDFEGPLDLSLFLLSKNKIVIQDIPIALILEQYLAYLEQRKQLDLEVASEFITMAAHLMYIKTRMLLSIEDEEAQNEMEQLIQSLKERQQKDTYLRIRTLTETLGPMSEFGRNTMTKNPEPMERGKIYEYDHEKADLVLAMQADAPCPVTTLRVDGGASVSDIMMQTEADLLRLPVDRPAMVETTAFGAAALAGLAAGVWSGTEELERLRRSQHVFSPLRDEAACAADYRQWKRAVERSAAWVEPEK